MMVTGDRTVRSYEKATQQIILADNDVTGQNFELKPTKAGNADETGHDGEDACFGRDGALT